MKNRIGSFKITSLLMVLLLLFWLNTNKVSSAPVAQDEPTSTPTSTSSPTLTFTPSSTATPTFTPTPLTGLTLANTTYGCTSGPYITCSASVVTTHTDPYRWDFDITYTYGDNKTWTGSNFTFKIKFNTGIYYTDVPIWWNMYPITNEVMPNRRIDIIYSGVPDLPSMNYPSGTWAVPGQPIPYNDFTVVFSRTTTAPEILVRTDKWHLTLATYPNVATPTNTPTPTATFTSTSTSTPTSTPTITPTLTFVPGTPHNGGIGTCWASGASWPYYDVLYTIDSSVPTSWHDSIHNAAFEWNSVFPSSFDLIYSPIGGYVIDKGALANQGYVALTLVYGSSSTLTGMSTRFNEAKSWDPSHPPSSTSHSVQNLMTHEFGHWFMLEDINTSGCGDATMWHSVPTEGAGETKKESLETPDIDGMNYQYP